MRRMFAAAGAFTLALVGCAPSQLTWTNYKRTVGGCWSRWDQYHVGQKFGAAALAPLCVPATSAYFLVDPAGSGEEAGVKSAAPPPGEAAEPMANEGVFWEPTPAPQAEADALPSPVEAPAADVVAEPTPEQEITEVVVPSSAVAPTAPPAGAPPAPESEPASEVSSWEVQVAAVAYDFAADTLAKELRSAGHEVRVAIPSGDDIWYRVRITGLSSRAEAKALALRLSAGKYPGAWVPPAPYPGP